MNPAGSNSVAEIYLPGTITKGRSPVANEPSSTRDNKPLNHLLSRNLAMIHCISCWANPVLNCA